jgi:hypothetical protein
VLRIFRAMFIGTKHALKKKSVETNETNIVLSNIFSV